jgi:hypothetical protein
MTERFADGGEEHAGYSRAVRRGNVVTVLVEIEAQAVVPA